MPGMNKGVCLEFEFQVLVNRGDLHDEDRR